MGVSMTVRIAVVQGLLKDQLEVLEEQGPDGRTRFTIKPLSEQLSFDKVHFQGRLLSH